jgi:predicted P-loop ATPase
MEGKRMSKTALLEVASIDTHHFNEWKDSAVIDKIIRLNIRTIYDSREVDKILNRNTKSRRKHSDNLVPAWCVSGVDPLTGENTLEGVQVKPDTPLIDKKNKVQKYLNASDVNAAPLFLNTGIENYWLSIIEDKSQPVIITEGAKKAGAGLSLGIPTISIPGVGTCKKGGRLHYWLESFAGFGRSFYLCFDADVMTKRPVQNELLSLARELSATGSKVYVINLPSLALKGMDDYIAAEGGDKFKQLMDDATTIQEWKQALDEQRKTQELEQDEEERSSKIYRAYRKIKAEWGDSLRLNTLKKIVELDEAWLDLDLIKLHIAIEFDMDISKDDAQTIITAIAKGNAYNPVVEYLDSLAARYPNPDTTILDDLASRYFGSPDKLHNIYMKKILIAAVARARQPGCQAEDVPILVGAQGLFKSTFWKQLIGADWFTDELSDSNDKDELMKLHKFWGLEIPEIEHIYKRKDISTMKKFLSSTVDAFRTPYDREIKEHPRSCILLGTSNEHELLSDPTGNRRYWIIPVLKPIPIEDLIRERDMIWAAANYLYQTGHQWYLTPAERLLQEQANKEYQTFDPWEDTIATFLQGKETVTSHELLFSALGIEAGRQDKMAERRVSAIMRQAGWEQKRKWVNGHALRVWIKIKKVSNLSGSSGSSGSTHIQQGFEHDPDSFPHLDHLDQYEAVQPENAIQLTISDPDDPDTQKHLDHPEALHSKHDPDDPDDPDKFQTFFENNSLQVDLVAQENPDPKNFPAEACPVTGQFMPAGFERTVKDKQVVFAPIAFKRGKKTLSFHLYIRGRQFETSISWPQSKEAMIVDLEILAANFINRYF